LPTYEYHCPACDARYELRQGFDAPTTHTCEECGKGTAKRVLHAPPIVFKGSGWYITDSRNKQSALSDSAASTSDSESSSTSSSASESTGEAAAAS
jgi:putative FmdB family regulatory protein